MLHKINEAFERDFATKKCIKEDVDKHQDLLDALRRETDSLMASQVSNLKQYEIAYQNVIEDYFPDKSWWEVCDFNIFMDLFNNRDPYSTIEEIVDHIVDDDIDESVDSERKPIEESSDRKEGKIIPRAKARKR